MYYIVTTMTTVGYGDISPSFINPLELIFGIFLMISGVMVFTMASATLSSILQSYDVQNAKFNEKLLVLNRIYK